MLSVKDTIGTITGTGKQCTTGNLSNSVVSRKPCLK